MAPFSYSGILTKNQGVRTAIDIKGQTNSSTALSVQLLSYFEIKSSSSYLDPNYMTNDCCSLALFSYFLIVPQNMSFIL